MYSDKEVVNLIQWGIEGEHYVFADEEIGLVTQPEGITAETNGYFMPLGLYGDARMIYFDNVGNNPETNTAYTEAALGNKTKGVGFAYDPSAMTNQIMAIQGVITEYQAALDTGTADIETTYPEFIQKLKDNGIDEVIADKQAQFDAWPFRND
jgi:putative aldouronate transport system substrate-binding protein